MVAAASAYQAILRDALARVKPASDELREAERFVAGLNKRLVAKRIKASAMMGGSGAKGTHLKGDHDVDIFVRFDLTRYGTKSDQLSDLLEQALPRGAERVHGSRDYFQLTRKGLVFEIVPVLAVSRPEQAQNVTDMSPLHVGHVLKAIRTRPQLADEIRLAKQFCKSAKAYGAESYLNGFSGHVIDLLILQYGSFLSLLTAAAAWGERVVLDPAGHHPDPASALDGAKLQGPMILVDPVQPMRNAAAALSPEAYGRFIAAAKAFLAHPSLAFFTVTPLTAASIKRAYEGNKHGFRLPSLLLLLETTPLAGKEDVVATKLLTLHRHILKHAALHGFTLLDEGFAYDKRKRKALHSFVFKEERLPATREAIGPPLRAKKDAARFREKHPKAYEKDGRLYAAVQRHYRTPRELLDATLQDAYVQERAERIRRV